MTDFPRLRSLGTLHRLALTLLCVVLAGGFAASASYLQIKVSGRDQVKGMSLDDVKGTYHGIRTRAPLLMALERNHPETLPAKDRETLIKWLNGTRITEDYDNPDLGDDAPAEIIARHCVSCHGRNSQDAQGRKLPLEFLDDVRAVAVSRDVSPNPVEAVVASTHAHAVSLATLSMLLCLLMACTRWRGAFTGIVLAVHGLGLLSDIGGWWLTRHHADLAALIVAGGAAYFATSGLLMLMVLAELWLPARDKA